MIRDDVIDPHAPLVLESVAEPAERRRRGDLIMIEHMLIVSL